MEYSKTLRDQEHIGESTVKKENGRFIYGLITKLSKDSEDDPEMMRSSIEDMRDHALKNNVKKIELQDSNMKELKKILLEVFKNTGIEYCIVNEEEPKRRLTPIEEMDRELKGASTMLNPIENWKTGSMKEPFLSERGKRIDGKFTFCRNSTFC